VPEPPLLESPLPIVAAPMAGGASTVALAAAVTRAGGFAFMPAGYKSVEALAEDLAALRGLGAPYGINLFVPGPNDIGDADFRAYAAELGPEADAYGLTLGTGPRQDDDEWSAKLALLLAEPVPVVSFTFGLPDAAVTAAFRRVGTRVLASVTTVDEARAAEAAGVDGLVVQGPAAGGHSATHDPRRRIASIATGALVAQVVAATGLPVSAAGGVDGPAAVRELVAAGAESVAIGTLLLRTDESGASRVHKDALADPTFTETVMTHAFTGRPARALRNGFIDRHDATAPYGYPALHHLTRELRQAAGRAGDADRLHLWAGTGFRNAPIGSAADVVDHLAQAL